MPKAPARIWVTLSERQWETVIALLSQEADGLEEEQDALHGATVKKRVAWLRAICREIEPALHRAAGKEC